MKTKLIWKKGLFSNTFLIYSGEGLVGSLNEKTFSKTARGELNGQKYTFRMKGVFNQTTELLNQDNRVIGQITYGRWRSNATLSIPGQTVFWKYDNMWNTRWKIFNHEGMEIRYSGSSSSGTIASNTDDPLLLMSGLFVINYYRQVSIAVFVAIFVPIMASITH
ncbi:MAG: hypothetical protein WCY58_02075 [Mariniphaga sp.]|nr:hypothetical protein [Mariniphaga sp.]MDD4227419.1 hypothetical protein [Mariniphaga sp.]MDD4425469.1 hypothetical protein [Mariniphaga sp.]